MALGRTQVGRGWAWSVPRRQLGARAARCLKRILASALPLLPRGMTGVCARLQAKENSGVFTETVSTPAACTALIDCFVSQLQQYCRLHKLPEVGVQGLYPGIIQICDVALIDGCQKLWSQVQSFPVPLCIKALCLKQLATLTRRVAVRRCRGRTKADACADPGQSVRECIHSG